MTLLTELRSRIQYKIIIPFLLLTLLVALSGTGVSLLIITGTAQERLNNQLAQTARHLADDVVTIERANLTFLREMAFAGVNPHSGAPAVADAIAGNDTAGLERALDPYFRVSADRASRVDRLIAFDATGRSLIDWERPGDATSALQRAQGKPRDLRPLWFVGPILAAQHDQAGDKFAGLMQFDDGSRYLFTAAPVEHGGQVVGGLIVAIRLETLLREVAARAQVAIATVYDPADGQAFASSVTPAASLDTLRIDPGLLSQVRELLDTHPQQGIFDTVRVNERDYQFAYAPLRIRDATVAILSVALASDYVIGPWSDARLPLTVLTLVLMLAIVGLGIFIARQITRPLEDLAATARDVIGGNLDRRSGVKGHDEVGVLASSFNAMTAHLLELYGAVQAEANRRAAIFESIADGILVVTPDGQVQLANPAMRSLLGLGPDDPLPERFADLPLRPLDRVALNFGSQATPDLFYLGERVVRVDSAPIRGDGERSAGSVYVLQDLTSEVAIDRAKTNFIATISHELRTPLTVIGGNADLLLSGLLGPLSDDHRQFVATIRRYTTTTTVLINNVITIAGLDAGIIPFELEPVDLYELLHELRRPIHGLASAKGLELTFHIPGDLPPVLAAHQQLRTALHQVLDNACRYTDTGRVDVYVAHVGTFVQIDIVDTGRGIEPELRENLFSRFTRGSQGINSPERGLGLGLALARELLERQHGQIWIEQSSSAGATFRIIIQQSGDKTQNPCTMRASIVQ
jgi:signal transduction histidine kinase